MDWRTVVVLQARTWIGTRFHHQGRVKKTAAHKGGVDCLGLLVGVARELRLRGKDGRLLAELDEQDYSMLPDGARLRQALTLTLSERERGRMGHADILLMELEGNPQHVGIVSEMPDGALGLIHAYTQARGVVEHVLDEHWQEKIVAVFGLEHCFE